MPLSVLALDLDLLGAVCMCVYVVGGEHNATGLRNLYHMENASRTSDGLRNGLTNLRENRDKRGHDVATGK